MEIVWDERKRLANIGKHGLDFADVTPEDLAGAIWVPSRDRRFRMIFRSGALVLTVVARPLGMEGLAIISLRRASREERGLLE